MTVGIHETMPKDCTAVRKGTVLRLFDAKCTNDLKRYGDPVVHVNPQYRKVVTSARRALYISQELGVQVPVCELVKPFARKGFLLRMDVHRVPKCDIDKIRIYFEYSEATNSVNGITVSLDVHKPWPDTTVPLSFTMESPSLGDPFGFGSSGLVSANFVVSIDDPAPDDSCTTALVRVQAHLNHLGAPIDYLYGTPIDHDNEEGCGKFKEGNGPEGFWTAANFSHGAAGLIMQGFYHIVGVVE